MLLVGEHVRVVEICPYRLVDSQAREELEVLADAHEPAGIAEILLLQGEIALHEKHVVVRLVGSYAQHREPRMVTKGDALVRRIPAHQDLRDDLVERADLREIENVCLDAVIADFLVVAEQPELDEQVLFEQVAKIECQQRSQLGQIEIGDVLGRARALVVGPRELWRRVRERRAHDLRRNIDSLQSRNRRRGAGAPWIGQHEHVHLHIERCVVRHALEAFQLEQYPQVIDVPGLGQVGALLGRLGLARAGERGVADAFRIGKCRRRKSAHVAAAFARPGAFHLQLVDRTMAMLERNDVDLAAAGGSGAALRDGGFARRSFVGGGSLVPDRLPIAGGKGRLRKRLVALRQAGDNAALMRCRAVSRRLALA